MNLMRIIHSDLVTRPPISEKFAITGTTDSSCFTAEQGEEKYAHPCVCDELAFLCKGVHHRSVRRFYVRPADSVAASLWGLDE